MSASDSQEDAHDDGVHDAKPHRNVKLSQVGGHVHFDPWVGPVSQMGAVWSPVQKMKSNWSHEALSKWANDVELKNIVSILIYVCITEKNKYINV